MGEQTQLVRRICEFMGGMELSMDGGESLRPGLPEGLVKAMQLDRAALYQVSGGELKVIAVYPAGGEATECLQEAREVLRSGASVLKKDAGGMAPVPVGGVLEGVLAGWRRGFVVEDLEMLEGFASVAGLALKTERWIYKVQDEHRRALEQVVEVREGERRRIARELHDMVLQELVAALQALQATHMVSGASELESELAVEIAALRRSIQGLREVVSDLRMGADQAQPFTQTVQGLVERSLQIAPELDVDLRVADEFPVTMPRVVSVELLRILQEGLSNVRRHSGATSARISLSVLNGDIHVELVDNGRGFVTGNKKGLGLIGMQERAYTLQGELAIESRPGKGTKVAVKVPSRAFANGSPDSPYLSNPDV